MEVEINITAMAIASRNEVIFFKNGLLLILISLYKQKVDL